MKSWSTEPWHGKTRIILGIDIGTTQSSVSFAHLFEGGPQVVQHVTRWPGQPDHMPGSKIPTLVYYDKQCKAVCYGTEALKPENIDRAEDEGWYLAKHFKLHLHPRALNSDKLKLDSLPPGVPLATIYTDFLRYLLQHTQSYFEDHIIEGRSVWKKCGSNTLIVLTHPNGWTTREQHFLKQALSSVGGIYRNCQVNFVTEAEASVHFCMFHSALGACLRPNTNLVVCDAGGSTIDTTTYHVERITPTLTMRERKASACIQAGGIFVDIECEKYFSQLLMHAGIDEEDVKAYVSAGVEDFEATAKKEFVSPDTAYHIGFHDNGLKKPELGIRRGRMSLSGSIIQSFFDQVVPKIIQSVKQQMRRSSPKYLLLVGGFGQSRYLRRRLSECIRGDCHITVIDAFTSKAAADGAVIWATKLAVISRVTQVAYGTDMVVAHEPSNPQHRGRPVVRRASGCDGVKSCWSEIVGKGVSWKTQESCQQDYSLMYRPGNFPPLGKYCDSIWIFRGDPSKNPGWVRDKDGHINPGFESLCRLEADLSKMGAALVRKHGPDGSYDYLGFSIAIEFGGTELRARIQWTENGDTQSGPVSIIPEPVEL